MMLLERHAHANRWRRVDPAAKGLFTLCGLAAVFMAPRPAVAAGLALVLAVVTLLGAGTPLKDYLRVAAPALLFLATSALTLSLSLNMSGPAGPSLRPVPAEEMHHVARVCARSLGGLAALLFLGLTTPMNDIIALLRRLKTPEVLLDLMTLCYRMLFVLSEAVHDMHTAQAARLGQATPRLALRSLGILAANLMVQVWQRSLALHQGALARNNDGPLRFLEPGYPRSAASLTIAVLAGGSLIVLTVVIP
ncbi:cobalt ECF transporter T component CbiQ [Geobacter sp. SVR]|uniref:cobalt ECF transporter T component CbiQ n=1 Tax=Geobacter sp. SVR TaxID=2495594 RepID=UPI00143EF6B1|nr:cobalt ECF transporter T component CbiQ [Geobacter sp. SVR]BCS53197.1 cobalt ECF transporter T component CbiQ [Geobacter sp. SVR]GCF84582.1 cobalt ECF transporter T component CbiQ [Geobacter sp. SVR]